MNLHLAIINKDISAKNEKVVSEVNRMVRMPEEESKNPLTRLAEEIKKKAKKKNRCNDEEDAQSDATELEENIKDTIKRNVLKY